MIGNVLPVISYQSSVGTGYWLLITDHCFKTSVSSGYLPFKFGRLTTRFEQR